MSDARTEEIRGKYSLFSEIQIPGCSAVTSSVSINAEDFKYLLSRIDELESSMNQQKKVLEERIAELNMENSLLRKGK